MGIQERGPILRALPEPEKGNTREEKGLILSLAEREDCWRAKGCIGENAEHY